MSSLTEIRQERLRKVQALRDLGINPYPSLSQKDVNNNEVVDNFSEYEGKTLSLAGRLMSWREHGELIFGDIQDESGRIQLYIKKEELAPTSKESQTIGSGDLNLLDIGDFIEAKGEVTKTQRGEISLATTELKVLSKSLRPLPEKWEGLKDKEERYRRRYLDLVMDEEVRAVFKARAEIIAVIRGELSDRHFLEVQTPTLQTLYGGASARPFKTHINAYDMNVFLRIAPELYLKRLLAGGYDRVFEFTTNFRNEGVDREHNPEFSVVEWYAAYHDYTWNMELCEQIFEASAERVTGSSTIKHKIGDINFKGPYKRIRFAELMMDRLRLDIGEDYKDLVSKAQELALSV